MEFKPRSLAELNDEARNIMQLSEGDKIREFIKEQQAFDKERMDLLREERANERDAQRAANKHALTLEQLKQDEARKIREHELAMRQENHGEAPVPGVQQAPRPAAIVPSLQLSKYVAGEQLEPFLVRFEDMAACLEWSDRVKAVQFMDLFTGQPLEIIMRIDQPNRTYEEMKNALLQAYGLTAEMA